MSVVVERHGQRQWYTLLDERKWRWRRIAIAVEVSNDPLTRELLGPTHAPALGPFDAHELHEHGVVVWWPRPLHLLAGLLLNTYIFWAERFIWPLMRHVVPEGADIPWPFIAPVAWLAGHPDAVPTIRVDLERP